MTRSTLALLALLSCAPAFADGNGTLNDTTLELAYTGGPLVLPNPAFTLATDSPTPGCVEAEGTPICDTYSLTVDFSDAFRANPANSHAIVDLGLSFTDGDDWDIWMYDSSDEVLAQANGTDNPETISQPLSLLPNGVYKLRITPFFVTPDSFNLSVGVSNIKSKSAVEGKSGSGLALGAFGLPALFALLGLALARRRA